MSFKNKKIAFVFPGQGSQYIGMGIDFYEKCLDFHQIYHIFQNQTGFDLIYIMRNGPEENLKDTKFTQPAILAHSIMALQTTLMNIDIKPDFVAGHSLGEFSALCANGVLNFSDALYLVHKRGEFMIRANDNTPFAMSAIIGLDSDTIIQICEEASKTNLVVAANFNTPTQTVISGTAEGVELASQMARDKNAKRVMPLVVGGPFHSPLIRIAQQWLSEEMAKFRFSPATVPVICNVNALPETNPQQIIYNLIEQVTSAVQWVNSIKYLHSQGVEIYIEFGPKKVLSGMITQIIPDATVMNIDKYEDIEKVSSRLGEL